jgi:8-oxo-dGTP diphosphatase
VNEIKQMAFDHQQILTQSVQWLQKRIQEHPLAVNLLPKKFSLRQLQNVYEAILNVKLDRRNFRKKFVSMGLLTDVHEMETNVTHRLENCIPSILCNMNKRRGHLWGLISKNTPCFLII